MHKIYLFIHRLNTFATRHVLFNEESSFYDSDNSRGANILVYLCLSISVIAVGSAFVKRPRDQKIYFFNFDDLLMSMYVFRLSEK